MVFRFSLVSRRHRFSGRVSAPLRSVLCTWCGMCGYSASSGAPLFFASVLSCLYVRRFWTYRILVSFLLTAGMDVTVDLATVDPAKGLSPETLDLACVQCAKDVSPLTRSCGNACVHNEHRSISPRALRTRGTLSTKVATSAPAAGLDRYGCLCAPGTLPFSSVPVFVAFALPSVFLRLAVVRATLMPLHTGCSDWVCVVFAVRGSDFSCMAYRAFSEAELA